MDIREILHWLVDRVTRPHYELAGQPDAGQVHAAIDAAHGYKPPEPALTADEQAQLDALQAKQRAVDAARAESAAGVEQAPAE